MGLIRIRAIDQTGLWEAGPVGRLGPIAEISLACLHDGFMTDLVDRLSIYLGP